MRFVSNSHSLRSVMPIVVSVLCSMRSLVRARAALHLEVLALRHQLLVLERSQRRRVRLTASDRLLWVVLSRLWSGMADSTRPGQAADCCRLAPPRLPPVLDVEEPTAHRPADGTGGRPRIDPYDVSGESALGCAAHSRRVAKTRDRRESVHGRQVHGPSRTATLADVEDVPREPLRPGDGGGLLCGPDSHLSPAVRVGDPRPRTTTRRACRDHRSPDCGVDGPTTAQRLSR